MAYQTKCPHCQALYPLTKERLADRTTRAKCGKCGKVFLVAQNILVPKKTPTPVPLEEEVLIHDGLDIDESENTGVDAFDDDELDAFLSKEHKIAPDKYPPPIADPHTSDPREKWLDDLLKDDESTAPKPTPSQVAQAYRARATKPKDNPALDIENLVPVIDPSTKRPPKAPILVPAQSRRKQSLNTLMYFIGSIVLIVTLVAQYAFFNVDTLVKTPHTKRLLQTGCNVLNCTLPNAQVDAFVQAVPRLVPSAFEQNRTDIVTALVNRSNSDQLYPNLRVRLFGDGVQVGQFIATPSDYLIAPARFMHAGAQQNIMWTVSVAHRDDLSVEITPFY